MESLFRQAEDIMRRKTEGCDYAGAVELYTEAARGGCAAAMLALGRIYRDGEIVAKDEKKAAEYYIAAAETGDSEAQYTLGLMYAGGGLVEQNSRRAFELYKKAAEQGHEKAANSLANMYRSKQFGENYPAAAYWYARAAEHGSETAAKNLENLMEYNADAIYAIGVDKLKNNNEKEALPLLERAAKLHHIQALCLLGEYYEQADAKKAAQYFASAAAHGSAEGAERAGDIYFNENLKKAKKYYKTALSLGSKSAAEKLAECYTDGRNLFKRPKKAAALLKNK